jgi:hypothetical protein
MKSTNLESYPQGPLTPLKHSVIGFRRGGGAVLCCAAKVPGMAIMLYRTRVSEFFEKSSKLMKTIINARKLTAVNFRQSR